MQFKNLIRGHKNQAVEKILKGSNNKVSIILSLPKEWKKAAYRGKLDVKEMFLAYDQECWKVQLKVTKESVERVDILVCNHKEADTRLSLHVKHYATKYRKQRISLVSHDTC